jgi:hypothetical protein
VQEPISTVALQLIQMWKSEQGSLDAMVSAVVIRKTGTRWNCSFRIKKKLKEKNGLAPSLADAKDGMLVHSAAFAVRGGSRREGPLPRTHNLSGHC